MKYLSCILIFLVGLALNAQLQKSHWYFGTYAGVDFSSGTPVTDTNGQINTLEGCTSISDEYGNLLFYTDGKRVYNRNHVLMNNGDNLLGHSSSTQSAIVLPKPDDCNLYYLFTIDVRPFQQPNVRNGLRYSMIDMSLNGGFGGVIPGQKNILLPLGNYNDAYEKLTAISNADNTGYWLLTHYKNNFYAFSVDENGINITPVVSASQINSEECIGYLKGSPDGKKMGMANHNDEYKSSLSVYDFDNATGIVFNENILYQHSSAEGSEGYRGYYGIEFSPNSQILYSTYENLVQYDLNASNIFGSEYVVAGGGDVALQLALNGKIYQPRINSTFLNSIEDPDVLYDQVTGNAPLFILNTASLGTRVTSYGLPTFLNHYFRISISINGLSVNENQIYCTGENLEFNYCYQGGEIEGIHWDFGDGNTSTDFYPEHHYNDTGTFTITLTIIVDGEEFVRTFEVTITGPPNVENAEQMVCLPEGISHTFDLEESLEDINPNGGNYTITFHLNEEDAVGNENSQPTILTTSVNTTIWVRVEDENGCFVVRELNLIFNSPPEISVTNPDPICIGSSTTITVETEDNNIVHWYATQTSTSPIFTGNPYTTPSLMVTTSYWVEAVSEENCFSDRIEVVVETTDAIEPQFDIPAQFCLQSEPADLPLESINGIIGTWVPSIIDTNNLGTNSYTFTPEEGQCSESYTIEIEITDIITAEFDFDLTYCQSNEIIELSTESDNGISGIWSPSNINTSIPGIQVYTFTPDDQDCHEGIQIQIEVLETLIPEFDLIEEYCLGSTPDILPAISENGITGIWNPSSIDTSFSGIQFYTFTSNEGQCAEEFILQVEIKEIIIPEFDIEEQYCLNSGIITLPTESVNGVGGEWNPSVIDTSISGTETYIFTPDGEPCSQPFQVEIEIREIIPPYFSDLTTTYCLNADAEILPAISDNGVQGSWFPSFIDTSIQGNTTYTFIPNGNHCSEELELTITVYPHPEMEIEEEIIICAGDSYTYTAPSGFDSYLWTNQEGQTIGTEQTVVFSVENIYTLTVEINGVPCPLSRNIEVRFSVTPVITEIKSTENTLTVYATGNGPFEYSLNEIFWQSSNTFTNVQPGIYYVYVRDKKGCGTSAKQAGIMGITNFISPNGDGYNDTWEIRALEVYPNTRLKIFDRYGKMFVDKILTNDFKWDGKYNSQPLPSGTYWYILILENGEKISGHINLRN